MQVQGTVFKYGDNVDTDVIIPARYLNVSDAAGLAAHAMEDIDPAFASRVAPGDIIVAGSNFGCGSSREHAPLVLKECGVACIVAPSFARIFYRNAINIGLPILECAEAAGAIDNGDKVSIDFATGVIENLTTGARFEARPFPAFIQAIVDRGGLINSIRDGLVNSVRDAQAAEGARGGGSTGAAGAAGGGSPGAAGGGSPGAGEAGPAREGTAGAGPAREGAEGAGSAREGAEGATS